MINHIRTLLLNSAGDAGPPEGALGEEVIPEDYRPVEESPAVRAVRQAIFGFNSDRNLKNYRLRQILHTIHNTELEDYLYKFDERVTYWPFQDQSLFTSAYVVEIKQIQPADNRLPGFRDLMSLLLVLPAEVGTGPPAPSTAPYQDLMFIQQNSDIPADELPSYHRWKIHNDGGIIRISRQAPVFDVQPYALVPLVVGTGNLSQHVPLPDANISIQFRPESVGGIWSITATRRPQSELGDLLENLRSSISGSMESYLFGNVPRGDFKVFADTWQKHNQLPYLFSAVCLATAYRMEDARRGGRFEN